MSLAPSLRAAARPRRGVARLAQGSAFSAAATRQSDNHSAWVIGPAIELRDIRAVPGRAIARRADLMNYS